MYHFWILLYHFQCNIQICCTNELLHFMFSTKVQQHPWTHSQVPGLPSPTTTPTPYHHLKYIILKGRIVCAYLGILLWLMNIWEYDLPVALHVSKKH